MISPKDANEFNGIFTPYFRDLLKRRRHALHHSYADVAHLLGVSSSSVRKWEHGLVANCHTYHTDKVQAYICGRLERNFADEMKLLFTKSEWEDFIAKYTDKLLQDEGIKKYDKLIRIIGGIHILREIVGLCFYALTYLAYRKLNLYHNSQHVKQSLIAIINNTPSKDNDSESADLQNDH